MKIILLIVFNMLLFSEFSTQDNITPPELIFSKVFEVDGRQGIAADSSYYYVSGSKALYKYNKEGMLLLKNESPFEEFNFPVNHLGDIDVYKGELFAGCEWFEDGQGKNIQIAVYDCISLKLKRTINWHKESGQVEVSGITVDKEKEIIWMTDWVDGSYIYKYDLSSGNYLGKTHLQPVPQYQQGILAYENILLITADDGDAEEDEHDNLYFILPSDKSNSKVFHTKEFIEFSRTGEIEGLTVDPVTNEILVLMNRGARIILGMPGGFYPGYDHEIHEIYVYQIKNKN